MHSVVIKRHCDHDRYKVLPCPNAGVGLDEYFDTMIRGRGGWGNLCRECTVNHGYVKSQSTTHMVWNIELGFYESPTDIRRREQADEEYHTQGEK